MIRQTMVGIGEMKLSEDPTEILVAPNLGSCLGVSAYDVERRLGGMIHCLLPLSKSDPQKAKAQPCLYVDTGVTALLEQMFACGATRKTLVLTVGGGGNLNDENNVFEIGKRNYTILKKLLWKNNLLLKGEHVGDGISRTVSLEIGTGKSFVKAQGTIIQLS